MGETQSYINDQLRITSTEGEDEVTVRFHGKSILRDPNEFVMPILLKTMSQAQASKKRVVLDFRDLSYMNSSTVTPVIKILEQARIGDGKITLTYNRSLKWQHISFSALLIFQTNDHRIEIVGVEQS